MEVDLSRGLVKDKNDFLAQNELHARPKLVPDSKCKQEQRKHHQRYLFLSILLGQKNQIPMAQSRLSVSG